MKQKLKKHLLNRWISCWVFILQLTCYAAERENACKNQKIQMNISDVYSYALYERNCCIFWTHNGRNQVQFLGVTDTSKYALGNINTSSLVSWMCHCVEDIGINFHRTFKMFCHLRRVSCVLITYGAIITSDHFIAIVNPPPSAFACFIAGVVYAVDIFWATTFAIYLTATERQEDGNLKSKVDGESGFSADEELTKINSKWSIFFILLTNYQVQHINWLIIYNPPGINSQIRIITLYGGP